MGVFGVFPFFVTGPAQVGYPGKPPPPILTKTEGRSNRRRRSCPEVVSRLLFEPIGGIGFLAAPVVWLVSLRFSGRFSRRLQSVPPNASFPGPPNTVPGSRETPRRHFRSSKKADRPKSAQIARSDRTNFRTRSPHGKRAMFACKTEYSGKGGKRITHRPFGEGWRKTCVEPAFFVILKAERAALDFVSRFASRSDENSPLRTTEDCNPAFDNPDCSQ